MEYENKVVLITGTGQGLGKNQALGFAEEGAFVACNSFNPDKARATAQLIREKGGRAEAFPADVADREAVTAMVAEVQDKMGPIDILVNNAGGETTYAFKEMPPQAWDGQMGITLGGVFNCSHAVVPQMIARGKGKIVNIGSVASFRVSKTGGADYTTAKHAVLGLTKHLAYELAMHGINVNMVCPGLTVSEGLQARYSAEVMQAWAQEMLPLGQVAVPRDITEAVLFLASEKARMITGQYLVVDCGIMLVAPGSGYRSAMEERLELSRQTVEADRRRAEAAE